jgi:hypothetical protein
MAKRISDEEIKLSIIINGDPAQKEILDLEKVTIGYKQELKSLEKQQKSLERQRLKDSDQYRNNAAKMRELTASIDANEAKLKELIGALDLGQMTMDQLRHKAMILAATLKHLSPNTEDFQKYTAELEAVNDRMAELRGNGQQAGFSIGAMADRFNRYAGLAASVIAAGTGVVLSIQKVLDMNSKLSDSQTNVMKTTGMTKQEVDELTKSFGMLKTRTGRIELLGIAEIGGRLGIAKSEIADFVKVMDKSAVALGDSFEGGPEVVAEKLGRIKGLYEELKNAGVEEAFEAVGSALNDLGADDEQKMSAFKNTLLFLAKAVAVVTAALVTNVAWLKLVTLWTARGAEGNLLYNLGLKARAATEAAAVIGTRAMVLVQNMLTLNVKGTVQAYKALTAAMKTTPFGLVLALVAAAAAAYAAFADNVDKVSESEKAFNEVHLKVVSGLKDEKEKIDQLISIAKDEKVANRYKRNLTLMPNLDPNQGTVLTPSTPLFATWGFIPDAPYSLGTPNAYTVNHHLGDAMPPVLTVYTKFKDVAGTSAVSGLGALKYKTYIEATPNPGVSAVVMSSPDGLYTGPIILHDYANGIAGDMVYTFQNLNLLDPGTYVFTGVHRILGANSLGGYTTVSQATFTITLNILPPSVPQFTPSPIIYNWVIGSAGPLASSALTITTPNAWVIKAPAGFAFNDPGGVTLVQPTSWGGAEMSGTGNKTFVMAMFAGAVPNPITQNPLMLALDVNDGALQVPIQINFTQASGLFLATQYLHFVAYKGISNATPQFVHIYWPGTYTFVVPPWLEVYPHPASYNMNCGFYVLSEDNMEAGIYEFDVLVTNEAGTVTLGTIHVVYEVIGAVDLPYPAQGHAYTLDRDFIEFTSEYDNTYFEVQLAVKAYDFYSQAYKEYSYPFKVALFNRQQRFNIGQVVHRLMAEMPDFLQEADEPYFPAEVSLAIKEKSTVDANFLQEYQINNIRFIAGLRPQLSAVSIAAHNSINIYGQFNAVVACCPQVFFNGNNI